MRRLFVSLLFVLLVGFSLALDYSNYTGGPWHLTIGSIFSTEGVNESLEYDQSQGYVLHIQTSKDFVGTWKLWKVIPHPPADDFYIEFKIWEYAPGIDLDNGNSAGNSAGEAQANDGPNVFAFVYYSTSNTTDYDHLGFDPSSISWNTLDGYMCHMHIECNFMGDRDDYFYCLSKTTYKGWFFDGKAFGDNEAINKYDTEPITQEEWHTVVLHIKQGQCLNDNLTLVIMGADPFKNRAYEWKVTGVRIYTDDQNVSYDIPLNDVYDDLTGKKFGVPTFCGDGIKQTPNSKGQNEECDGKDGVPKGYRCTSDCKLVPVCGDNMKVDGEVCDGTDTPKGYKCSSDCKSMTPICGDGIVVKEEECDDNAPTKPGYVCVNCHLLKDHRVAYSIVDMAETLKVEDNGTKVLNITTNSTVSITPSDLTTYISVKKYSIPVHICTPKVCGEEYSPSGGVLNLTEGLNHIIVFNKGGEYYIGVKKPATSKLVWIVLGIVGVVILAIILTIVFYFVFMSKKDRKHKLKLIKRKKNKIRLR